MELLLKQRDLEFLLYEFLDTESLLDNERYREHDRETLDAVIEAGKKLAEDKLLLLHHFLMLTNLSLKTVR